MSDAIRQLIEEWRELSRRTSLRDRALALRSCAGQLEALLVSDAARHQEELINQLVIGHGHGQAHAIADVNAGLVDDLIAPRLQRERDAVSDAAQPAPQAVEVTPGLYRADHSTSVFAHALDKYGLPADLRARALALLDAEAKREP